MPPLEGARLIPPAAIDTPDIPSRERTSGGIWPGILLTSGIAGCAIVFRRIPGMTIFSPMTLAVLLGMVFRNLVGLPSRARPGIKFAFHPILRFAIILLGLQLTISQIEEVGLRGFGVIVIALMATFEFTKWLGRAIGIDWRLAELIAAGTSICGASAVIPTNTVTRASDEDAAYAVACVTLFGTIAMFVYPFLAVSFHLDARHYGVWAGASIHEIAQVTAGTFQNSFEAGHFGTIAKLSRVMLLAPLVIGLGFFRIFRMRTGKMRNGRARRRCCRGSSAALSFSSACTASSRSQIGRWAESSI